MENDEFMTTDEVCKLLHVTTRTIYRWKEDGKLKPVRAGRRLLFPREEVLALLKPDSPKSANC